MMKVRPFLYLILCLVALSSCEHRELTDAAGVHYIRVYLDEEIKNINCGIYNEGYSRPEYKRPAALRAALTSRQTGDVLYETILRKYDTDQRGTFMEGYITAERGDYSLMIYQMGSPTTLIREYDDYMGITAYTMPISQYLQGYLPTVSKEFGYDRIMVEPEHLLYSKCDNVAVSLSEGVDTLRTKTGDYFTAHSLARSYYIQLQIKGVEWVHAAAGVLSGMAGSFRIGYMDGMVDTDPVSLFFTMSYADKQKRASEDISTAVLYTVFTTFGKIPDLSSVLTLNFEFTKSDGTTQVETIDLTEEFNKPMAVENQWILLDKEIVITAPSDTGGMTPGVEGWKEESADIIM